MGNLLAAGLSVLLVLGIAGGLAAHTALRASTPADAATLTSLPPSVRLEFTSPIEGPATAVRLIDGDQNARSLNVLFDGDAPTLVEAPLPRDLPSGTYQVSWRTMAADGHVITGDFSFALELPAPSPAQPPTLETGEKALTPPAPSEPEEGGLGTGALVLGALGFGVLFAAGLFLRRRPGPGGPA